MNDVWRRKSYSYVIARLRNSCLITFLKKYRSSHMRCRSSHRSCSVEKGFLTMFQTSGKHLCWSLALINLPAFGTPTQRLQHKCFPVKFAKPLRTPILKNICKRLLLEVFYKKLFLRILTGKKHPKIKFQR